MSKLWKFAPSWVRPHAVMGPLVWRAVDGEVASGPFRGMKYVSGAVGGSYLPKLVGCYEKELVGPVEEIVQRAPARLIDVGAAEGYYAVGLAQRIPGCRVVSFERGEEGRALHAEMAELNGVADRSDLRGDCGVEELRQAIAEGADMPVIICDVEGFEETLLDPAAVPDLAKTPILVEVHENFQAGLRDLLQSRFAPTHNLTWFDTKPRSKSDYPFTAWWQSCLPSRYSHHPLSEFRSGDMGWFWMLPKAS